MRRTVQDAVAATQRLCEETQEVTGGHTVLLMQEGRRAVWTAQRDRVVDTWNLLRASARKGELKAEAEWRDAAAEIAAEKLEDHMDGAAKAETVEWWPGGCCGSVWKTRCPTNWSLSIAL